jgi:hypothetical protein
MEGMMKSLVLLVAAIVLLISVTAAFADDGSKMLVRIYGNPEDLPRGLDVAGFKRFQWLDAIVDQGEYIDLASMGLKTEVLMEDVEAHGRKVAGVYHTLQQIQDSVTSIATKHPDIARLDTLPFTTYEGRVLLALKISGNVNVEEDEPELLFIGNHHAREWPGVEIILFAVDTLTRGYGIDAHITDMVNSNAIWFIPISNPDGFHWSRDLGHDWRKNRTLFSQWGTRGVDLNRNYDGSCDGTIMGAWGNVPAYATSRHSEQEVYDGPGPASEQEMRAEMWLTNQHDFIISMTYHTYAECVMWPWGYSIRAHTPDDDILSDVATAAASKITQEDGSGTYEAFQSAGPGMYPTSGGSDDWFYGWTFYERGSNLLPFTIEAGQSFQPPQSNLDQINRENWDAIEYLCDIADSVRNILVPYVVPPVVAPLDTISADNFTIEWKLKNPKANATMYELQELSGFSSGVDSAEQGIGLWAMEGFTISTARKYSGNSSFYSTIKDPVADTSVGMTTKFPYPVKAGDSLTYWYYANIENRYDYAYAEVSYDGYQWDLLDTITGTKSWTRRAFSLDNYAGGSIFIRFRYEKDDGDPSAYEGFYVDDISPVAHFDSVAMISSSIPDTFYSFTGKEPGEYWYRLKGYNVARGWGYYGQLLHTQVVTGVAEGRSGGRLQTATLLQNSPNPFRSTTTISMVVPAGTGLSRLSIFDQAGRAVRTFALKAGSNSFLWDGKDESGKPVPSGVYFYGVRDANGWAGRKMVLAR